LSQRASLGRRTETDDYELLARVWEAANAKARELGWILAGFLFLLIPRFFIASSDKALALMAVPCGIFLAHCGSVPLDKAFLDFVWTLCPRIKKWSAHREAPPAQHEASPVPRGNQ